jgi:hypothetical protein
MLGMQSSTTADQENLPLVDRPTACCIVSGGICKIKTTLLLQYPAARRDRGEGVALHFAVPRD